MEDCNWKAIFCARYRSVFNHYDDVIGQKSNRGLGTTYDVHLGLIEKRAVDFLLVIIELFSVAAEALQAKIYRKSAIWF